MYFGLWSSERTMSSFCRNQAFSNNEPWMLPLLFLYYHYYCCCCCYHAKLFGWISCFFFYYLNAKFVCRKSSLVLNSLRVLFLISICVCTWFILGFTSSIFFWYALGRHAGTPLHHAAKRGHENTVKLLLTHGGAMYCHDISKDIS